MATSRISIHLKRGTVYFNELSFIEYKGVCKALLSDDINDIVDCMGTILKHVDTSYHLNVIEKFICLINIRNSILGTELMMEVDNKVINYDLNAIDTSNFLEIDVYNSDCRFITPSLFKHDNITEKVADCLYSYRGNVVYDFPLSDKIQIIEGIDIQAVKLLTDINEITEDSTVSILEDYAEINVYELGILSFLRSILNQDLMSLYSFEYNVNQNLNLKGQDLEYYTLPELKIMMNLFFKAKEDEKREESSNSTLIE